MAAIFLLEAEHFSVPGRVLSGHATREGAERAALELVNLMVKDHRRFAPIDDADATNWRDRVETMQDYHGAQYCYADISEIEVEA